MVSARGLLHYLYKVSGESLAVVYVTLSMSDMVLSVAAFMHGVPEGNPVWRGWWRGGSSFQARSR